HSFSARTLLRKGEFQVPRLLRIIAILLILTVFAACGSSPTKTGNYQTTNANNLTFTDATHTTVTLSKQPTSIACLVGICEDILAALRLDPVAVNDTIGHDPAVFGSKANSFRVIVGAAFDS